MGCLVFIQVFSNNFINYLEEEVNSMLIKFAADNNWEMLPMPMQKQKRKEKKKKEKHIGLIYDLNYKKTRKMTNMIEENKRI